MNTKQKRTLQAFRRIQGWLSARPDLGTASQATRPQLVASGTSSTAGSTTTLGNVSADGVGKLVNAFNAAVDLISANATDEEMHDRTARSLASEIGRLRKELVDHQMRDIAVVAESAIPEIVRMTVELRRVRARDGEGILAAAYAMAKTAVAYRQTLVQRGLPSDFVEQLTKTADNFKSAIDNRAGSVTARHHARKSLEESVQSGKRLVTALTVAVQRRYRDDKPLVAAWNQLKHVALVGARSANEEEEASTTTATPSTTPEVQKIEGQERQKAA